MLLFLLTLLVIIVYALVKRHYSQWKRLGIPSDEHPSILVGSLDKIRRQELSLGLALAEIYQRFQDKFVGIYLFFKPAILVRDLNIIRHITMSAFDSFHDRGIYVDEKYNPMSANLLTLNGQQWRSLRTKFTPSFSSGKLKGMFETVDDVALRLIDHMSKQLKDGEVKALDLKELITTYTVDIIGSEIFGLDIDSFANPDNEFRSLTDSFANDMTFLEKMQMIMTFACPLVATILGRLGVQSAASYRLRDIVKLTIENRERHGVVRKDLLQLLIQLRNTGKISDDSDLLWSVETTAENLKSMSIDMIASNLFLFYMAGSETTAAAISFTIYELAMNPEVLKKAQEDVDKCMEKHDLTPKGRLTYEAVNDMTYLDYCIMETLRKYPPLPFLNRMCNQDYPVQNTDFIIKKGTAIIIPVFALHRNPEYFPNPLEYKPERFSREKMDYNPMAYYPFGQGPRKCIGQRLSTTNAKTALAKILANFNIQPIPYKEVEFDFHTSPVLMPNYSFQVSFVSRTE